MQSARYELIEEIGVGGMGEVHRAYDRLTDETVALKRVLVPPDFLQFNTRTDDDDLLVALAREFKVLASLRHPNIISVLDYGFTEERIPCFTMEYLPNAISILNAGLDIDTSGKIDFIIQLLQGLAYLHQRGLIHRDLKPANVMVVNEQVKIIDFGLAMEPKQAQSAAGTLTYIAPEIFAGEPASFAADLYAVGLMTYQLFMRKYPFDTLQRVSQLIDDIVNQPINCAELPEMIRPVVEKLLAKNPADRYASAFAAIEALSHAIGENIPSESAAIRESYLQASKFVGRATELNGLQRALHTMLTGTSQFYLIGGESGVGKSRLIDELRTLALVEGALVIQGQAVAGVGLPFQVWRNIARRLALHVELDDTPAGILKEIVPDIAQLLQRPIPDAPELTGKAYQNRLISTLLDLIKSLERPLLIVLEDLQWTFESLLPLRQILNTQEQYHKLMIIGTFRNDERPELPDELPAMQVINLERLENAAIAELSQAMLGQSNQDPAIIEFLAKETEGNTFFMVEVVRTLAEQAGRLRDVRSSDLHRNILTGGMHQILHNRLIKITPDYQPALQFAALIGRQIDVQLLHAILPEIDIQDWLYHCETALVLHVQENEWLFAHDKLREAVVADIASSKLPQLHRHIARGMEAVYPNEGAYHEVLLYHWQMAEDFDKEIEYLNYVGDYLTEHGEDFVRAKNLLKAGLDKIDPDDERRIALTNLYMFALWKLGEYDEIENIGQANLLLADKYQLLSEKAFCLRTMGMTVRRQGDFEKGKAYYEEAVTYAEATDDKKALGFIYNSLGLVYLHLGDPAATMECFEKSIDYYRAVGNDSGIGLTLNSMGMEFARQQDYVRSYECLEEGLRINKNLNYQWGVASAYNNIGLVATWEKNYAKAETYTLDCLQIFRDLGTRHEIANSMANLSHIQLLLGNPAVRDTLQDGLALAFQIQAIPIALELMACWSWWRFKQGNVVGAAELIGFVQNHPAHNIEVDEKLGEVLPLLHATFAEPELQTHYQTGAQISLDDMVDQLLNEDAVART